MSGSSAAAGTRSRSGGVRRVGVAAAWLIPIAGLAWWLGRDAGDWRIVSASVACVGAMGLWASGAVPDVTATLLFFAAMALIGAAPPPVLFSGFGSPGFWLVLSGMVLAGAMARTGLGPRIARRLTGPLSVSYRRMVAGVVVISYALAFLIPSSMGRIALLVPVTLALADAGGLPPGRRGRTGLVLAAGFGSWVLSTSVLTANLPNLVMVGAADALYGERIAYLPYLILHAPVLGVLKGMLLIALICWLFPDRVDARADEGREVRFRRAAPTKMSGAERRLSLLLLVTVLLWALDGVHGVAPAWIGLAGAAACLLPGVGVLAPEAFGQINVRLLFYVAGLLGLVAVVGQIGLGSRLGHGLLAMLPLRADQPVWANVGLLTALAASLSLAVTADGAPALYTALSREMSIATGMPLTTVLMVQVAGFSAMLLPYQAPPIAVAAGLGDVRLSDVARLGVWFGLSSLVLLTPVQFLWWRVLGFV